MCMKMEAVQIDKISAPKLSSSSLVSSVVCVYFFARRAICSNKNRNEDFI